MWSTPRRVSLAATGSPFEAAEHDLRRLLPSLGPAPTIHFRTLNGFQFRAVALPPGAEETTALRIRRVFAIQPPKGEPCCCAVDVTTAVRGMLSEATGHDFPPDDPVWDLVCRTSLCAHLWAEAELPPDVLPVYHISREQLEAVRVMIGQSPHAGRSGP